MQPNNTQESWEKEFDDLFPLSYFATENYHGKVEDGELALTRWQKNQTEIAEMKRINLKGFMRHKLIHQKKTIRESIENIIITGNRQEPMEAQAKFRNLVLSLPSLTITDEE